MRVRGLELPEDFNSIVDAYLASEEFGKLAARTADDYQRYIKVIRDEFGSLPLSTLTDDRVRGVFLEWRDRVAKRSRRAADYGWSVLARVVSWAHDRRKITSNPCLRAGKVSDGASRVNAIWTDAHEAAFLAEASPQMRMAFILAIWTGQRQGDVLALKWAAYDGTHVRLRQGKTGRSVIVKVGAPLRTLLGVTLVERHAQKVGKDTTTVADLRAMHGSSIVLNDEGEPFTSSGFRCSFRRTQARAKVKGLTFHDIRGTTATRLAEMGSTDIEIASVTGHSISDVKSILDSHYLSRTQRLGDNAIDRLERRVLPTAAQLPTPNLDGSSKSL